jgi:hypothetical protein
VRTKRTASLKPISVEPQAGSVCRHGTRQEIAESTKTVALVAACAEAGCAELLLDHYFQKGNLRISASPPTTYFRCAMLARRMKEEKTGDATEPRFFF